MKKAVIKWPLAALLAAFGLTGMACAQSTKPNVLFVLVDDMGWGDLGVFYQNGRTSSQKFATPNLDSMATSGMQLRRHYCPAPVCAPSRASLLLGVHQGHSNIRNNQFDQALDDNHTLGTVLQGAGYATACIGKWGLQGSGTPDNQPSHPLKRGFDYFFGYISHLAAHYHYPEQFSGNDNQGQPLAFLENTTNINANLTGCYSTDLIAARAKRWITDHRTAKPNQPFFIYLTFAAPHARLDIPTQAYPAGKGLSGGLQWVGDPGNLINTASGVINSWIHPDYASQAGWTDAAKRYATMIRRIDDAMGDLLATLDDLGIANNTLVVFTSDNGAANEAGAGGAFTYDPRFFDSYGPLEGIKRDVLEGGSRVPALVHWPGKVQAGTTSQTPAQFHDWMPTLAEFAGLPQPERSDGVSLAPTLTGLGSQRPPQVYIEYHVAGNTPNWAQFTHHKAEPRNEMQVVYVNGYKGIRTGITAQTDDFRIYDTLNDPAETVNLAGRPGVPPQDLFKDRALQMRRVSTSSTRVYDNEPVPAAITTGLVNGLEFRAYEKVTPWVPDWETETAAATGTTPTPDVALRTRTDDVGLWFNGYLNVPTTGTYTFYLTTDTGAFVRLHDLQLIDADFGYAPGTAASSGAIPLAAGHHPLRIHYRHGKNSSHALKLEWSGPGITRQEVPATQYFRTGEPVPQPPNAANDRATTQVGTAVTVTVLANDSDDGTPGPLTVTAVTSPRHGYATIEEGNVRYTPHPGFAGEDHFTYTISDGVDTASATVDISVYPPSALAWLPLDESAGTTTADAFGQPVGTLSAFPDNPWQAGRLGNALEFDGTDDRVVLTGRKGITGTAARTVTFWLNAHATQTAGTRPTMVSWGNVNGTAAGTRFDINLNHTGSYRLRAEFNSSGLNFSTPTRTDLRGAGWVHCAIVVPANATVSQVKGYIDGIAATSTLEPSTSGNTAINTTQLHDITLGRMADGTAARALRGLLDDVRIYPRALDASEIAAIAATNPDGNQANLWHHRHSGNPHPDAAQWRDDPDGDGFSYLLEYALGGNPTAGSTAIAPRIDGTSPFRFNRRQSGLASSAYVAEFSTDLTPGSWSALPVLASLPHPALAGFDEVSVEVPAAPGGNGYVRLRVTCP